MQTARNAAKQVKEAQRARKEKAAKEKAAKAARELRKENKRKLREKNNHVHEARKRGPSNPPKVDEPELRPSELEREERAANLKNEADAEKKKAKAKLAEERRRYLSERHHVEEKRRQHRLVRYGVLFGCNVVDMAFGATLIWYGTEFGLKQDKLPTLWYGCGGLGSMLVLIGLTSFLLIRPSAWIPCCGKVSIAGENDWRVWGGLKASAYMTFLVAFTALLFGTSLAVNDTLRKEITNLEEGSALATPNNAVFICFGLAGIQALHFWAAQV
jgi:hypothetical protein